MQGLIDRQAAIDAVEKWFFDTTDLRQPKEVLWCVPSAQPEIIRCKDCEHYDDGMCRRWKYSHVTAGDSFCCSAEPRLHITGYIPEAWIENEIEWLRGLGNSFASLTAMNIKAMLKRWHEQESEEDR